MVTAPKCYKVNTDKVKMKQSEERKMKQSEEKKMISVDKQHAVDKGVHLISQPHRK